MLSYRHIFHAGNFADVMKHVVLVASVTALQRKTTACYFQDTHAGRGGYDLAAPEADLHREFEQGIARVAGTADAPPAAVARYLDLVWQSAPGAQDVRYYPGSPSLLRALMGPQDRLLLTELHPADHSVLAAHFRGDRAVQVHHQDAYQGLKAFLPPPEGRGLVLIDPPYERKDEYERVVEALRAARIRWPQGVFLLWYPLMSSGQRGFLHDALRATGMRKLLCAELLTAPLGRHPRFVGSGVLIANPPWRLDEELGTVLPWLVRHLGATPASEWHLSFIVPE